MIVAIVTGITIMLVMINLCIKYALNVVRDLVIQCVVSAVKKFDSKKLINFIKIVTLENYTEKE